MIDFIEPLAGLAIGLGLALLVLHGVDDDDDDEGGGMLMPVACKGC